MLRDIKGPLALAGHFPWLWLVVFLVVAAALVFLLKRRRRPSAAVAEIPLAAHAQALARLEVLSAKDLARRGLFKDYYSEISAIIRSYLEDRFALNAPEMTTEEFLGYARDKAKAVSNYRDRLQDFLTACDLVKFAKATPSIDDAQAIFIAAHKFVEETALR